MDILRLLTLTYPRYVDSLSREAVENTLHSLAVRGYQGHKASLTQLGDNKVFLNILDWLKAESSHLGKGWPARYVVVCVGSAYLHHSTADLPLLLINLCY